MKVLVTEYCDLVFAAVGVPNAVVVAVVFVVVFAAALVHALV